MEPPTRRTLTPAVVGASGFVVICALVSVAFVAARGGLELPLASSSAAPVAVATTAPPAPTAPPTASPSPPVPSASPSPEPPSPSPQPSDFPSPSPSPVPTAIPDPLTVLPACPDHPGCYVYTVRRGDTLGRIADRYAIPLATVVALNPEVADPSTIVLGQPIYLARDPYARLDRCPNRDGCYLYVVRPGDTLSTIAGRFGVFMTAILDLNPALDDPNAIYSGQVIRLPGPAPASTPST